MLFRPEDIEPRREPSAPAPTGTRTVSAFRWVESTAVKYAIPTLEHGYTYHVPCFVNWSLHDVLERILEITGPADVCLTSWAISEEPARKITRLLADGVIKSLHCLFDHRVTRYCPAAMQLVNGQAGKVKLAQIHAKVLVIENDEWGISVTSTANATNKKRIEKYVIACDEHVAKSDREWIMREINR